jgi:hypothetical protein
MLTPGESIGVALFIFGMVVLVLALLCAFFKLLSLAFIKEAAIKGACSKFMNGFKAKIAKPFQKSKKKEATINTADDNLS